MLLLSIAAVVYGVYLMVDADATAKTLGIESYWLGLFLVIAGGLDIFWHIIMHLRNPERDGDFWDD